MTKLDSSKRIRTVRTRGGNTKYRALRLDTGNFAWGSEHVTRKTRLLAVVSIEDREGTRPTERRDGREEERRMWEKDGAVAGVKTVEEWQKCPTDISMSAMPQEDTGDHTFFHPELTVSALQLDQQRASPYPDPRQVVRR